MAADTHADMHTEHRRWGSDIGLWRDEIDVWEEELRNAGADLERLAPALPGHRLARLRNILRAHRAVLDTHRGVIDTHDSRVQKHEHVLATFEGGGPAGNHLLKMAKDHRCDAPRHARLRDAHEHLKRCQHTLLARWPLLLRALAEPT
jgi:hypothetical protein